MVSTILTAALLQSCAHNPARALSPNAEEVKVLEPDSSDKKKVPTGFVRGEDPLDEQEFYSVIGDTASTTVVRSSRSMGSLLQSAGLAMLVTGVLAAASGLAMYALSTTRSMA